MVVTDYPCPECGYEGPHHVYFDEGVNQYVAECGDILCGIEFGVPSELMD